jgi:hypothetical protein
MVGQLQYEVVSLWSKLEAIQLQSTQGNFIQGNSDSTMVNDRPYRREVSIIPDPNAPVAPLDNEED